MGGCIICLCDSSAPLCLWNWRYERPVREVGFRAGFKLPLWGELDLDLDN